MLVSLVALLYSYAVSQPPYICRCVPLSPLPMASLCHLSRCWCGLSSSGYCLIFCRTLMTCLSCFCMPQVGKRAPQAASHTDTSFKSKRVRVSAQSILHDLGDDDAVTARGQGVQVCQLLCIPEVIVFFFFLVSALPDGTEPSVRCRVKIPNKQSDCRLAFRPNDFMFIFCSSFPCRKSIAYEYDAAVRNVETCSIISPLNLSVSRRATQEYSSTR